MVSRLRCRFGLVSGSVPRFRFGLFPDCGLPRLGQEATLLLHFRSNLSTTKAGYRDKSNIYNTNLKVDVRVEGELDKKGKSRAAPVISPPEEFSHSLRCALDELYTEESQRLAEFYPAGLKLNRYIKSRTLPVEGLHLRRKQQLIEDTLKREFDFSEAEEDLDQELEEKKRTNYNKRLKQLEKVHLERWVPVNFDKTCSFAYLLTRTPAEYAVLETIFKEISRQEAGFKPRTMFDFGSGLCTAYWASQAVFGQFSEVFCVDTSTDMNDLARNIITKGDEKSSLPTGMSFRLHCPSSTSLKYDLVVCAFSLMEIHSSEKRLEIIHSLWSRVEEGGCLVVVEVGTNAGFQIISESRDFVLQASRSLESEVDVVAPCPHTFSCPRYNSDIIPCNFPVRYKMFDIKFFEKSQIHTEDFTYVVLKKGKRSKIPLPRLVEEPLKTKNNFYCRMCTQTGTLQEIICKKSTVRPLYEFTKYLHHGDEIPISLEYQDTRKDTASQSELIPHQNI